MKPRPILYRRFAPLVKRLFRIARFAPQKESVQMAWFKYDKFLKKFGGTGDAYDKIHKPGETTPFSGIYRCESCGIEVVSEHNKPLPPTHAKAAQGHQITWRLVVYADHENL